MRPAGFEPTTNGLEIRCSIQLSYERKRSSPEWGKSNQRQYELGVPLWGSHLRGDLTAGFAGELAHDALSPDPCVLAVVVDAVAAGSPPPIAGELFGVNFREPILNHAAVD